MNIEPPALAPPTLTHTTVPSVRPPPSGPDIRPFFNNSNRLQRIYYRFSACGKLSWKTWKKGVPVLDILRTQFPLICKDPAAPAVVTIELTNACNLRCVYCTSQLALRPRGFMSEETLNNLQIGLDALNVHRVRLVGNGEPTLHPKFETFIKILARPGRFLSVLTNANWGRRELAAAMLEAPVDLVEVSVDGITREEYEESRVGGRFEKLVENLKFLRMERDKRRSQTLILVRVMLRPMDVKRLSELRAFWKQFADDILPQFIIQRNHMDDIEEVSVPVQRETREFPKCSMPFKAFNVSWNGDVPLCSLSVQQVGPPGLLIGNVTRTRLDQLWRSTTMCQYREGHAKRDPSKMPICQGCPGI